MRLLAAIIGGSLILSAGCAGMSKSGESNPAVSPETVLITYHVKPGKEQELTGVLENAWEIYLSKHLVFSKPHVVVQTKVDGKPCLVEVLTWVNHNAPEQVPDSVKTLWGQMGTLCEERDGRPGVDGGEVQLLAPRPVVMLP